MATQKGTKVLTFKVDPFLNGGKINIDWVASHKSV